MSGQIVVVKEVKKKNKKQGPKTEAQVLRGLRKKQKKLDKKEGILNANYEGPLSEVASLKNQLKQLKVNQQRLTQKTNALEKVKHWLNETPNIANAADYPIPYSPVDRADLINNPMVPGLTNTDGVTVKTIPEPLTPAQQVMLNSSFHRTKMSTYLRSMLLPMTGPAHIPDDMSRPHKIHTETITNNIPTSSLRTGLFILYPNHPGQLVGYHYMNDAVDSFTWERTITVAQNLSANYDYGRKVSQIVKIFCSTVPGGAFNIQGTMNAVRIDGTVTETTNISDPESLYATMLASTENNQDKIGDVQVSKGVGILSLPTTFNTPYRRFNDSTPASIEIGSLNYNYIEDETSGLVYRTQVSRTAITTTTSLVEIIDHQFNVDSTQGLILNCELQIGGGTFAASSQTTYTALVTVYDPMGLLIFTYNYGESWNVNSLVTNYSDHFQVDVPANYETSGPIGSVRIQVSIVGNANPWTNQTVVLSCEAHVPSGGMVGINNPIVLVMYTNVLEGATMTVSGVAHFELIPNPALRANIDLEYPRYDRDEMDYVKDVIGNRQLFNLRSVYDYSVYVRDQPVYEELANAAVHTNSVKAFGWGDILGSIKDKFVPGLLEAGKNTITDVANKAFGNAASGALAASGRINRRRINAATEYFPKSERRVPLTRSDNGFKIKTSVQQKINGCVFPCVISNSKGENVGCTLYAACPGDLTRFLGGGTVPIATAKTGYKIFNYAETSPINLPITMNLTLLPIRSFDFASKHLLTPIAGEEVSGHSCDAAMILACKYYNQVFPYAITGEVEMNRGIPMLLTNPMYEEKAYYCGEFGLKLLGNAPPFCDIKNVDDVTPQVRPPIYNHKDNTRVRATSRLVNLEACTGLTMNAATSYIPVRDPLIDMAEDALRAEDFKGLLNDWLALNHGIEDCDVHRRFMGLIQNAISIYKRTKKMPVVETDTPLRHAEHQVDNIITKLYLMEASLANISKKRGRVRDGIDRVSKSVPK